MDLQGPISESCYIEPLTIHCSSGSIDSSLDDDMPLSEAFAKRHNINNDVYRQPFKTTLKDSFQCYESSALDDPLRESNENVPKNSGDKRVEKTSKIKTHRCIVCDKVFASQSSLSKHITSKHPNNRKCNICEETFKSASAYTEHVELHDPEDRVICKNCHAEFLTLKLYLKHAKHFPGPHNFCCTQCLRQFKSEMKLDVHTCICTNGQPLICACGQTFTSYPDVVAHARGNKPFYCCSCERKTFSLTEHLRHVRKHSKQKPFVCSKCDATFTMVDFLKHHVKAVHGNEEIETLSETSCSICLNTFSDKDELQKHLETHDSLIPCPDCGKTFRAHRLANHRSKHKLSSSLCPECGKLFESPIRLSQHLQSAHNNDPVTCDICNKVLKTKKILTEHLKTHLTTEIGTRVAQAVCPICGLELAQKGSLARHIVLVHERHRLVQDDKPRLCKDCGLTLPNKAKYYTHLRQHRAMVERYPCPVCQRVFNKKQNLVRHIYLLHNSQRVLEEPNFRCQICARLFRERKNLQRHCRLVHKIDDIVDAPN